MTEETPTSVTLANGDGLFADTFKSGLFNDNLQEQRDEILALQSIFNTEDEQRLMILSEVNEENDGLFTLQITVCPKANDMIQVSLVLPSGQEEDMAVAAAPAEELNPPALGSDVQLNRSVSGWHWKGSFPVKYLSPLYLHSTLPPSYPSQNPPQFHLSCGWLTKDQLDSLSLEMDNLWIEGSRMPIIFTWVNWLEDSVLRHLGITDQLVLQSPMPDVEEEEEEVDVVPFVTDINEIITDLIRYNRQQLDIEFCKNLQECHVCYCEKPGEKFFRLFECHHHFCHDCMAEFCLMHVHQGTVEALRCPDRGCNTIIPPYIVQAVMGPEAYQRWEQLLLQKTLDAMPDTTYCPRCNSLVIMEAEEKLHLACCQQCFFAFCTECEQSWHQGRNCVTYDQALEEIQRKAQEEEKRNEEEEKKYQELKKRIEEEIRTRKLLKDKTKHCPRCRIRVEKNGGCNKMTCKCGELFCWMCGKKIDGYNHFQNSNCVLFPGENLPLVVVRGPPPEAMLRIQARLAVNPDLARNRAICPTCKQVNLKGQDHNNHIKCWNCKRSFCFLCKQKIIGIVMSHFRGPCVQHS